MCSSTTRADEAYAKYCAARAELLSAIADLASTQAWHGDGASDLPSWLAARWQTAIGSAREFVRDSEALAERPALADALASGEISIDQSKALLVLGHDERADAAMLESLPYWSYAELEREARKQKAKDLERKDGGTYLRMQHTDDERFLRGAFQLDAADGARLIAAIDARVPNGTALRDYDRAYAVALVDLAMGSDAQRYRPPTVLVSDGVGELSSGGVVTAETAERLMCDANVQANGKTKAAVPPATRRAVEARDGGHCTFPGCHRTAYLECHHIVHRAYGGSNDMANLQLVCWTHHKLIHEGGWAIRGEAGARCTWVRPDGSAFEPRAPDP